MDERRHFGRIAKIICIVFSISFIITEVSYLGLNFVLHSEVHYLGIAALVLLFPFLLSVTFVMAVSAKRALDKGIEKNEDDELKRQIAETSTEEKENDK